jgi:transcriptional regulator with XRE-family HTH domain
MPLTTDESVVVRLEARAQVVKLVLRNLIASTEATSEASEQKQIERAQTEIENATGDSEALARAISLVREGGPRATLAISEVVPRLTSDPDWNQHPVVGELLEETIRLQALLAAEPGGDDAQWQIRDAVGQIEDLLATLQREITHAQLDDPGAAARFVLKELEGVDQKALARLLGFDPRTIRSWKSGNGSSIRKNPERVTLIAQLVFDLRTSMTSRGMLAWFDRPRHQLGDRAPLELIEEDAVAAAEPLRALARGVRGQLAT